MVKPEEKGKKVICGQCFTFISPSTKFCPTCGLELEEEVTEEKGEYKKLPIRVLTKAVEGKEEYIIPEVKKVRGKPFFIRPHELEKAKPRLEKIPVRVEHKEEKYVIPKRRKIIDRVSEKESDLKEVIKKEAIPEGEEVVEEIEEIGLEERLEGLEEGYEVREAKEEEWKLPPEFEEVPKKKRFVFISALKSIFRKKKEEPLEELPAKLPFTVEFAPLGEDFEEIEVYPLIEPFAYARVLYNRREHTRFYEVIEPTLNEKEKEILQTIEDAFTKSLNIRIDELDKNPANYLREAMESIIKSYSLPVAREEEDKLFYFIERDLLGYGKINVLMRDPNIEDISCDGPGIPIYIYHRRFESMETNIVYTEEHELESYVIRLAQRCGKHISTASPLIDATLLDGSRIVMTLGKEVSTKGSTFTIRKFREDPFTPPDLVTFKTLSPLMLAYVWLAVQYGMSILFVGGTASGKTTTLNAVSLFIPFHMKIVSIEETRELNLPHPNWIPGCTREGFGGELVGGKVAGEVNMYDLLKAALRERPEYIIVGEIRGPEAYVLFQAMATGHTTYSTMHADSVPSLIHRLENKPIEIPRVMIPSLDAVCIQIQTRVGGRRVRRVKQIIEIIGLDPHTKELLTNEVFRWVPGMDDFEFSGKSYVLEKIMVKANIKRDEILQELKRRQAVIEWLVAQGIRRHSDVARVIMEYQVHPEEILEKIRSDLGERLI
jgi:flagellar protein FlaI